MTNNNFPTQRQLEFVKELGRWDDAEFVTLSPKDARVFW